MTETAKEAARRFAAPVLSKGYRAEGLYPYTDPDGKPSFYRIRAKHLENAEKWIRPMYENGQGWQLGEPNFSNGKPLYRLHEILADSDKPVYWVEGEQKADALAKLGFIATTSGSCTSDDGADFSPLAERKVVIWPDHDESGEQHGDRVAEKLRASNCQVEVLDVSSLGLKKHGDVIDWLTLNPDASAADIETLPKLEHDTDWSAPQLLVSHDESAPYPLDALPGVIGEAVREVVEFVQCPVAIAACSAQSALSTAIQGLVNVRRAEKLEGPVSLYFLAVGESGERKSTCDEHFTSAIREWEVQKIEHAKPDVAKHDAELDAWKAKRDGLLAAIRTAMSKCPPKPTTGLEQQLQGLDLEKPIAPKVPRSIYGDITSEKLGERLALDWPSGAVISAEAGIVFGGHSLKGDSQMRSLALLNSLWSGETFISDRRTMTSYTLRGARLSMGLATQPDTLQAFFDATKGLARGSGFAARFLLAWPASTQGSRLFRNAPENMPNLTAFQKRTRELLDTSLQFDDYGTLSPTMLDLTPDAFKVWIGFHDEVEVELRAGGDMDQTRDVASKAADNAARLAALFHVYEHGPSGQVEATSMKAALKLVAWHLYEARRILGSLVLPVHVAHAMKLDHWLISTCKAKGTASVPRRDAQRHVLRDGAALDRAVRELADANWSAPRTLDQCYVRFSSI